MLTTPEIFILLKEAMPSIGFCSRDKRMYAGKMIMQFGEDLIREDKAEKDVVMGAIALLYNEYKPFTKAVTMLMINVRRENAGSVGILESEIVSCLCHLNNMVSYKWDDIN